MIGCSSAEMIHVLALQSSEESHCLWKVQNQDLDPAAPSDQIILRLAGFEDWNQRTVSPDWSVEQSEDGRMQAVKN